MFNLSDEQKAELGLKLATTRQEHSDLDAAIHMLEQVPGADRMMIQRLKKKKLRLKDEITRLEDYVMPDIIA